MSYTEKQIPANFTDTLTKKETTGFVTLRSYDEKERKKRMWKYGGGCLLLALFSILLPIIHFILVPGFLIASVAMVVINLRPTRIESSKALCPSCGESFVISKGKPDFPMEDVCGKCHHNVLVNVNSDSRFS